MSAIIIDGSVISESVRNQVAQGVAAWVAAGHRQPGLATVLVGENPASQTYVKSKLRDCREAGMVSFSYELPKTATQNEVEELVARLNSDDQVDGILVQLPLPAGLNEESILKAISIKKDVDGLHPENIGRLAQKGRTPLFVPCTPAGVMVMLEKVIPNLDGANAVVLGRSNIVGMPIALLLVRANATVTICHSRSKDLPGIIRQADVVVAAVGQPEVVKGSWIKPGAVIIDVGINRVEDASRPRGYRLVGDVAYEEAKEIASAITPVPGGVGLMTRAMLLHNTFHAAQLRE
jgi:methylenetetrahydrofolate dehydrogenase (NADP+) / methenyltetrahydrofolate cyclohydrolase